MSRSPLSRGLLSSPSPNLRLSVGLSADCYQVPSGLMTDDLQSLILTLSQRNAVHWRSTVRLSSDGDSLSAARARSPLPENGLLPRLSVSRWSAGASFRAASACAPSASKQLWLRRRVSDGSAGHGPQFC
uniref:Uncharacterized protein n=1 Tax=Eutreptiella gymnastica TaxID=73025 RepID=A0A7S4CUT3_9EUGL